jgi:hypothetical protein
VSVRIAARALLYDRHAARGLVGSVFRREGDRRDRFVTDVSLPMVDYTSDHTQPELEDLESGDYLIQISLPNGRVVTRQFGVQKGADTKVVVDIPHEGPKEWTSLQAMTGRFEAESALTDRFTISIDPNPSRYEQLRRDPENGYSLDLLSASKDLGNTILVPDQANDRLSRLIRDGLDVPRALEQFGGTHPLTHPSLESDDVVLFRFGHDGLLEGENDPSGQYEMGPGSSLERRYLIQQSRQGAHLIALPTPWMTPDGQVSVEVLVKKHTVHGELDYSMTIGDPMVNTALGYINLGAVHLAQRLIGAEQARSMLFSKVSYPLAAAIGGYILVLGQNTGEYRAESDRWKSWVGNLDGWFDWLPDGAILHATMLRMDAEPDLNAAREALARAYDRGLPFFTFGLKYLIDGLRLFASKGEKLAQKQLATLEPIAARTDPSVPFLSVQFANTWLEESEGQAREMGHV